MRFARTTMLALLLFASRADAQPNLVIPVELEGIINVGTNGTDWCVDTDSDGTFCESTEPNLTRNGEVGTSFPKMTNLHEDLLARATTGTGVPVAGNCWSWNSDQSSPIGCASDQYSWRTSKKVRITDFCSAPQAAQTLTNACTIDLYNATTAAVLGTIRYADSGGDLTHALGQAFCKAIDTTVNAGDRLDLRANSSTCSPAPTLWHFTQFEVFGYGVD